MAVIVAPIVDLIYPGVGTIIAKGSAVVMAASIYIAGELASLADELERKEKEEQEQGGGSPKPTIVSVSVNDNLLQNGEEFHIGLGEDLLVTLTVFGLNAATITELYQVMVPPYENGYSTTANDIFFEKTLEKDGLGADQFQIRINRAIAGYSRTGKISWGIKINNSTICVNGGTNGVLYRMPDDTEEKIYNNFVVVRCCILPSCPDYIP